MKIDNLREILNKYYVEFVEAFNKFLNDFNSTYYNNVHESKIRGRNMSLLLKRQENGPQPNFQIKNIEYFGNENYDEFVTSIGLIILKEQHNNDEFKKIVDDLYFINKTMKVIISQYEIDVKIEETKNSKYLEIQNAFKNQGIHIQEPAGLKIAGQYEYGLSKICWILGERGYKKLQSFGEELLKIKHTGNEPSKKLTISNETIKFEDFNKYMSDITFQSEDDNNIEKFFISVGFAIAKKKMVDFEDYIGDMMIGNAKIIVEYDGWFLNITRYRLF